MLGNEPAARCCAGYEPHSVLPQGITVFSKYANDFVPEPLKEIRIMASSAVSAERHSIALVCSCEEQHYTLCLMAEPSCDGRPGVDRQQDRQPSAVPVTFAAAGVHWGGDAPPLVVAGLPPSLQEGALAPVTQRCFAFEALVFPANMAAYSLSRQVRRSPAFCPLLMERVCLLPPLPPCAQIIQQLLSRGTSVVLCPGGVRECLYMEPGKEVVFLQQRKGFVR